MNLNDFFMMLPVYIAGLIIIFLVFLGLRKFMLWYWGIAKIHQQHEETLKLLKEILNNKG